MVLDGGGDWQRLATDVYKVEGLWASRLVLESPPAIYYPVHGSGWLRRLHVVLM